jgi:hypothetical protein
LEVENSIKFLQESNTTLAAGEVWSVNGAARLHLNAENGQEALLEIRVRGG